MRIYKFFIFLIFVSLFLVIGSEALAKDPYRPLCVGIDGKFIAKNWKGGPIQVGCVGDDGGATNISSQKCTGQVITNIKPGDTFRLTKCSCWGGNKGCLKVGKELKLNPLNSNNRKTITVVKKIQDTAAFKNNSCTINSDRINKVCGANGARIEGNIRITCASPVTPTPTRRITPTPTRSVSPTPEPSPSICPIPKKVTNVKVTCPDCFSQQDLDDFFGKEEDEGDNSDE